MWIVSSPHNVVLTEVWDEGHANLLVLERAVDVPPELLAGLHRGQVPREVAVLLALIIEPFERKRDPPDRRLPENELQTRVPFEHSAHGDVCEHLTHAQAEDRR